MQKTVSISIKKHLNSYEGEELSINDEIIIETERGLEFAKIESINTKDEAEEDFKVVRQASSKDKKINEKNLKEAKRAIEKASKISEDLNLKMTFVDSDFTFDRSQLMLYFMSDSRVDFRELAKQLAAIYKTRIELRQIGIRDKAKEVSGLGICGRKLCCSNFLKNLDSVSISMAKNQNLSLNPSKINGCCGRLLCCLNFEDDLYKENRKNMPTVGEKIDTDYGEGTVVLVDIPNRKYIVNIPEHGNETICLKCVK